MPSIKGRYARIEISLDVAENGKELFITGDYLSVISITGEGTCEIKLDHRHSQTIDFREISGITGLFDRLYLTTDGGGGICSLFVGTGMAIQVMPNPEKLWGGGSAGRQLTTSITVVQRLSSVSLRLKNVTISNSNGIYACYVGPFSDNVAIFEGYATVLLPHKSLEFGAIDMSTLGTISYDGVNNIILNIIGTYE
jgi:hypothetical protein